MNILYILSTGTVDINRLYAVGLIAGLMGTFLVIVHPIQKAIDRSWKKLSFIHSKYSAIHLTDKRLEKTIIMDPINLQRSLKLIAIKYEKDKIAGTLYFLIILIVIFSAFLNPNFQNAVGIKPPFSIVYYFIESGLLTMSAIILTVLSLEVRRFTGKVQDCGMYYELINRWGGSPAVRPRLDQIKESIDNNDWEIVKHMIGQEITYLWGNFPDDEK
ncbi:MAG TPA: hypothetical protein VJ571_01680 [Candidatus Nitrosotalea sp.]|nr:hypothetical protein [Candidatus Nitrosotalea sp.]